MAAELNCIDNGKGIDMVESPLIVKDFQALWHYMLLIETY